VVRRVAFACAVFAVGVVVGIAVLRPAHHGRTKQELRAAAAVAAASGGEVVHVACVVDHCGVVVRRSAATACQGWIVPIRDGTLGRPSRAALAQC
jgi:hypothetical protein